MEKVAIAPTKKLNMYSAIVDLYNLFIKLFNYFGSSKRNNLFNPLNLTKMTFLGISLQYFKL